MVSNIVSILSFGVALIALYISYRVYKRDTPKLRIQIDNPKYDCFFGNSITEKHEERHVNRISGARIKLNNNSKIDIEINNITLKIKKEIYRLIPKDNDYWEVVYFLNYNVDKIEDFDPNYGIYYHNEGIEIPCKINAYSCLSFVALFYNFPFSIKEKIKGKLIINTAIGNIIKKINLYEYNDTFFNLEWEDVKQYKKSKE